MTRLLRFAPIAAGVALLLSATPAQAQFGGLVNRAKDKMADKAKENVGPVAPGEQLTDETVDKVVIGAQAADRILVDRDRINTTRDQRNKELSALVERNGPVHQAYNEGNGKIMDCRASSLNALENARQERVDKRLDALRADPAMTGKMQLVAMKYGKAMADAQQKNDPVALTKVQRDMMRDLTGEDIFAGSKGDTVATDAKCGKAPAMPASLTQEEQLRHGVEVLDDSLRTLEARAVTQGAQASGLEQTRYLQLKERALSIMNRMEGKGAAVRYGDEEVAAVKKRQGDLERVKRAL